MLRTAPHFGAGPFGTALAHVVVEVVNDFEINGGTFAGVGVCNTQVVVSGVGTKLNDSAVRLGRNSDIYAQIMAWDSEVALGNNTDIYGHVFANSMHSDFGVIARACGTPPSTTTTTTVVLPTIPTSTTTTTISGT